MYSDVFLQDTHKISSIVFNFLKQTAANLGNIHIVNYINLQAVISIFCVISEFLIMLKITSISVISIFVKTGPVSIATMIIVGQTPLNRYCTVRTGIPTGFFQCSFSVINCFMLTIHEIFIPLMRNSFFRTHC